MYIVITAIMPDMDIMCVFDFPSKKMAGEAGEGFYC